MKTFDETTHLELLMNDKRNLLGYVEVYGLGNWKYEIGVMYQGRRVLPVYEINEHDVRRSFIAMLFGLGAACIYLREDLSMVSAYYLESNAHSVQFFRNDSTKYRTFDIDGKLIEPDKYKRFDNWKFTTNHKIRRFFRKITGKPV